MEIINGTIGTLNGLPYGMDDKLQARISEEDIMMYVCKGDINFYRSNFGQGLNGKVGETEKMFPLILVLISVFEVYEDLSDKKGNTKEEEEFLRRVYPFISQLAKIGAREVEGNRPPLYVMEEMIKKDGYS